MMKLKKQYIEFNGVKIGSGYPCFIIAEAGVNHNGSLKTALKLVDAAKSAGADAVKFQTFKAEKLVSADAPQAKYQQKNTGKIQTQFEMLRQLELSHEDYKKIFEHCKTKKIVFLSTPFDEESADFLDKLGVPAFKISSGELTNISLLTHIAKKKKPMIISTGMATISEIEKAVKAIEKFNREIILLHCVSSYPAIDADINLRAMDTLEKEFRVPVGYSDHSLGIEIPIAAAARGAVLIEKHFTLDKKFPGPDHKVSLEPDELKKMICGIRKIESALGSGIKKPCSKELEIRKCARKSIVSNCDLKKGTIIKEEMLAIKRPGTGIPPEKIQNLIGRKVRENILKNQLIKWSDII